MRVALISDIHGNSVALDAVLADIDDQAVDETVCLGDIGTGGPDPVGTVDRIIARGCLSVRGNADVTGAPVWWTDPESVGVPEYAHVGLAVSAWSVDQLDIGHCDYIESLPEVAELNLGNGQRLLAFHGSPRSSNEILSSQTPDDDLVEMISGFEQQLLAGGHTHIPMVRRCGHQTVVNPGSVGMPFVEHGFAGEVPVAKHGSYAIVTVGDGEVEVAHRQVDYSEELLVDLVGRSGMPHADQWLGIRTG